MTTYNVESSFGDRKVCCSIYQLVAHFILSLLLKHAYRVQYLDHSVDVGGLYFKKTSTSVSIMVDSCHSIYAVYLFKRHLFVQLDCQTSTLFYVNHARICSWNHSELSNKGKVYSSMQQPKPLMGLELTADLLQHRRATKCATPPICILWSTHYTFFKGKEVSLAIMVINCTYNVVT